VNVQNVVSYTVVITAANPDLALLPGMTANVRIAVDQRANVLKVPNAALRFRPAGSDAGSSPAPAPEAAAGGGGRPSAEQIRERLVKSLGLSGEQQKKLDPILADSRQQMMALPKLSDQERQGQARKIREATRARIREILTVEQRATYDELAGARDARGGDPRSGAPGRVWIVEGDKVKPVALTLGISDGAATEVLRGDLAEGQEIIVGATAATSGRATPAGGMPRLRL
jgi:HlyD family secretion protein